MWCYFYLGLLLSLKKDVRRLELECPKFTCTKISAVLINWMSIIIIMKFGTHKLYEVGKEEDRQANKYY